MQNQNYFNLTGLIDVANQGKANISRRPGGPIGKTFCKHRKSTKHTDGYDKNNDWFQRW